MGTDQSTAFNRYSLIVPAPSREIEFRHEPLLAPRPSEHHIVLDEQNRFALLRTASIGLAQSPRAATIAGNMEVMSC